MPYVADVTGRDLPAATLARRGVIALLLVAAVVAALLMQYRGVFRPVFPAVGLFTDLGDGLQPGADVKLRGALVGSVGGIRVLPGEESNGQPEHEVELRLRPEMAAGIPAGVTARVVPTNIFGAPSVELLDPPNPTGATLARNGVIHQDTSEATVRLQTVFTQLNKVLQAVHPAELNVALTNIADGLRGRGAKLGSVIGRLDPYLATLNGHAGDFTADLRLLGTDVRALADTAPELLDIVDNAVVTSRTVVEKRQQLVDTLTGTTRTTGDLNGFLAANSDRIIRLVHDGAGIAATLAPQRPLIPSSLVSLGQGASRLSAAVDPRRGGGLALEFTVTPFTPYTAADCPRYPGRSGPNCGTAAPPGPLSPLFRGLPVPPLLPTTRAPELPGAGPPLLGNTELPQLLPNPAPAGPGRPGRADGAASGSGTAPGSLPGLFPTVAPSGYQTPAAGGGVGPVGTPEEVRIVDALLGNPGAGAAGVLLLGPVLRGNTVVVRA